jgi:HK97 family phage portal protein
MINALFGKKAKASRYAGIESPAEPTINNSVIISGNSSDYFAPLNAAGVAVNERTAMQVSAVYGCVSLIGGAIATIPLPVYQRNADGREKADHDVWWLLNEQPNPMYSAATFWEAMLGSLLLHGDAFARIVRPNPASVNIKAFEWIHANRVTVIRSKTGSLIYKVMPDYAQGQSEQVIIEAPDMIHIAGPGFNGLRGMSQIRYVLRHAAGIAIAADQYSAAFFENGARPDFAIELAGKPTPEQQEMMRKSWTDRYQGSGRAHLPALLTDGAKVHELTMNAEDSQLLTTRQFQVEDICRIFGTPPHMVGHTQNTSSWGTGVEQMSIGFVKYTLMRHLKKIEQEFNRKIWPSRQKYFVEFNTAGLERGDYKTRNEGYRVGLGRAGEPGWMTVNEIRKYENLPPVADGDQLNTGLTNAPTANQTASA